MKAKYGLKVMGNRRMGSIIILIWGQKAEFTKSHILHAIAKNFISV